MHVTRKRCKWIFAFAGYLSLFNDLLLDSFLHICFVQLFYAQRDGCPKIINLGSARTDLFYERKKYGFKKR